MLGFPLLFLAQLLHSFLSSPLLQAFSLLFWALVSTSTFPIVHADSPLTDSQSLQQMFVKFQFLLLPSALSSTLLKAFCLLFLALVSTSTFPIVHDDSPLTKSQSLQQMFVKFQFLLLPSALSPPC